MGSPSGTPLGWRSALLRLNLLCRLLTLFSFMLALPGVVLSALGDDRGSSPPTSPGFRAYRGAGLSRSSPRGPLAPAPNSFILSSFGLATRTFRRTQFRDACTCWPIQVERVSSWLTVVMEQPPLLLQLSLGLGRYCFHLAWRRENLYLFIALCGDGCLEPVILGHVGDGCLEPA